MVVFLLLVIVAILLLGASRFMGVVGGVFAFGVAVLAAFLVFHRFETILAIDTSELLLYLSLSVLGIIAVYGLVSSNIEPAAYKALREKSELESRLSTEEEERLRAAQVTYEQTFHSSSPNKAERKRMRGR